MMGEIVLKEDIIKAIRSDASLFAKVATHLGYKPTYLTDLLRNNSPKLTQAGVLKILRERLNIAQDSELLEEMQAA